jgi:putative ABC transport system substrate-binding protein
MNRRAFITALGGATAAHVSIWPLSAHAQQQAVPVIGFLHSAAADGNADRVRAFRAGLKDAGFVEGENVAVEYRWADHQIERLPALATDLVQRRVAVIAAMVPQAALAAKTVTTTTPILFVAPEDPVRLGLVSSLARPDGNLTGVNFFPSEVAGKRLEFLRQLVPGATRIAVLVDPIAGAASESTVRELDAAVRTTGLQIEVLKVSKPHEIDAAFANFARQRPDAVFASVSAFMVDRRVQLALQAMAHRIPATYPVRDFAEAGGLMSYGASLRDAIRQIGLYAGRVLKGAKPAELPVVQSTKLELVINHQAARILGLTVPPSLLALADEVIE